MTYVSRLPQVTARLHAAIDAGVVAMAEVPMAKTRQDLATGFTSGRFTTGASADSVRRTEPFDHQGGRAVSYGTDLFYHRFWTLGGMNPFTRQFERVDKWTPHFYESRDEMLSAFASVFRRVVGT